MRSDAAAARWKLIKPDQYAAIFICQFITVALLKRINESLILNELNGRAKTLINLNPESPNYKNATKLKMVKNE